MQTMPTPYERSDVIIEDYVLFLQHIDEALPPAMVSNILGTSYDRERRHLTITPKHSAAFDPADLEALERCLDAWAALPAAPAAPDEALGLGSLAL